MYKYNIEEVCFSDGTRITPGPLTVIVGPKNSGKSRALRDIETLATPPQEIKVQFVNSVVVAINCG